MVHRRGRFPKVVVERSVAIQGPDPQTCTARKCLIGLGKIELPTKNDALYQYYQSYKKEILKDRCGAKISCGRGRPEADTSCDVAWPSRPLLGRRQAEERVCPCPRASMALKGL